MTIFDSIIGIVAPHICLGCYSEGSELCTDCIDDYFQPMQPKCAGCFKLSDDFKVCESCKNWLPLAHVTIATSYEGMYETLLKNYKFKFRRQNARSIAETMTRSIDSHRYSNYLLCPIPTAPARVRLRGFDHAKLITKHLGDNLRLNRGNFLGRNSNVRQLGSSRKQRIEHMKSEFYIKDSVKGKRVLVVDDVMTSGATLAAAAKVLKAAGAKEVSAVIFARQIY